MKILHIVEDFSIKSGGLRTVIKNLDFHLKKLGHDSFILASDKEKNDDVFVLNATNKWLYSRNWKNKILKIIGEQKIELIHIHGAWLYPQFIGAKIAIQKKIPMILSLHGMFQPWLWKKGTLKKKLYFYLLSKKYFAKAEFIHTITAQETETIKEFFKRNEIIEIPNLITIDKLEIANNNIKKNVVYLGRINQTKGIDLLIKAFSRIENQGFQLKIAGGFNSHQKELERLVKSLKLERKVAFIGEVKGEEKINLIRTAWVMVSPSYSDVIGMVNLEAASFKTPMITTFKTGLNKDWNTNGGFLINPNLEELIITLKESLNWSLKERVSKGELLYKFVEKEYSWENKLKDWEALYKKATVNEK
ncbi:MAG: glycosyltransferase [Polaribacter sp.]|jgi:glycosyltransferase involved in cell wall biosynthesis|nr:glycosyltransferase [Polaribacter sp.]MDG1954891.1 glycosyltransferase [Polaribacter sp.]MDG2074091.1 glycosyltransferase [Polaribacter sp.]